MHVLVATSQDKLRLDSLRSDRAKYTTSLSVALDDFGELPASKIASAVAKCSTSDFCALRLSCKAAFGATVTSGLGKRSKILNTGLSRSTTQLDLSSRVFVTPPAFRGMATTSKSVVPPCRASEFLARHAGVTSLGITQVLDVRQRHNISLPSISHNLPGLVTLSVCSECTDNEGDEVEFYPMCVEITCIGRLHRLANLTLHHCSLSRGLSGVLAQLPLLVNLYLMGCEGIGALQLHGLARLKLIKMPNTDASGVWISDCVALRSMDVQCAPSLVNLVIFDCPSLRDVASSLCSSLKVVEVSDSPRLMTLDVSGCAALVDLRATGCSRLVTLNAMSCEQLVGTNLTGCFSLEHLLMGGSSLKELDYTPCAALKRIMVRGAAFSSLAPSPTLEQLYLTDCSELSTLDLLSFPQLRRFHLDKCSPLSDLHVGQLAHLDTLRVHDCVGMASMVVSNCPALTSVNVRSTQLEELSLVDLPSLLQLDISSLQNTWEDDQQDVTQLDVYFDICLALSHVSVSHQGVCVLDLSGMSNLQYLDVSRCTCMSELSIVGCSSLDALSLSRCDHVRDLDLSPATQLRSLNLTDCGELSHSCRQLLDHPTLTSLHLTFTGRLPTLSSLTKLINLHLHACDDMTDINFTGCLALVSLAITCCKQIQHVDVTPLTALQCLKVDSCSNFVELVGLKSAGVVGSLAVYASPLQHLEVSGCPSLVTLDLAFCPLLKELSIQGCEDLETLELFGCLELLKLKVALCPAVSSLAVGKASTLITMELNVLRSLLSLDVGGCVSMKSVKLTDCGFTEMDFDGCCSIETIKLYRCPALTRVRAMTLPSLTTLKIRSSPKLTTLQLGGSRSLLDVKVGPDSPLPFLDLSEAANLEVQFRPVRSSAICLVCSKRTCEAKVLGASTVIHGFLHESTVHRVCSTCAAGVFRLPARDMGGVSGNLLSCPVCSHACQLAHFPAR